MTTDYTLWGIHAGSSGEANSLFLSKNRIAIGWIKMGSLASLPVDRDAIKTKVAAAYPEAKPGAIPNYAGQLFRFVHEMKPGDWVVYPSKADRKVYLGKVTGAYEYDTATEPRYPNMRTVKWLMTAARTQFSQGALYEIGSAMSLFMVKNYADEFRAVIAGEAAPVKAFPFPVL